MKTHAHDFFVGEQVRLVGPGGAGYGIGKITSLHPASDAMELLIVREATGVLGCYYAHEIAHLDGGDVGREMSKP